MAKNCNVFKYIPIIMGLLLGACYDDLGNYDYKEINELTVVLPEVVEVVDGKQGFSQGGFTTGSEAECP